jgi:ribosome production factor 2
MKPLVIFQGDIFETDFEFSRIKKFFFEFFKLYDIQDLNISVLRRVVVFSVASDKKIKIRCYETSEIDENKVKNSLKLNEIGPSLDLVLRRAKLASQELYKMACKQPKETSKTKSKNESTNMLGEKRGRVYMTTQDLNKMSLKQYGVYITII